MRGEIEMGREVCPNVREMSELIFFSKKGSCKFSCDRGFSLALCSLCFSLTRPHPIPLLMRGRVG